MRAALSADPVISEFTQTQPESTLELIESEGQISAPIAGRPPVQSSIETRLFASKIITTEPIRLQPPAPVAPASTPTITSVKTFKDKNNRIWKLKDGADPKKQDSYIEVLNNED